MHKAVPVTLLLTSPFGARDYVTLTLPDVPETDDVLSLQATNAMAASAAPLPCLTRRATRCISQEKRVPIWARISL